jgi:hypothetical protein
VDTVVGNFGKNSLLLDPGAETFHLVEDLTPERSSSGPSTTNTYVYSISYKAIWPTSPRQLLVVSSWQMLADGRGICVISSLKDDYHPEFTKEKTSVMATVKHGGWVFTPQSDTTTHAAFCAEFDLNGSMPEWIKNKVAERLPAQLEVMQKMFV